MTLGDISDQDRSAGLAYSIHSLYWDNVDFRLVEAQRNVFLKLGYPITQHHLHEKDHGLWIEEVLNGAGDQDVVVITDIDCIPLSSSAVKKAIDTALSGKIFGCAQSANHIDSSFVYAGPMFLALTGGTWRRLSAPSMRASAHFDVGGQLTHQALKAGVEVELVYPTEVGVPKWLLGDKGVFGAFTIYERSYLHLFESRNNSLIENFVDLANDICSGQPADYKKYVIRASQDSHELYGAKILKEASLIKRLKKLIKG